MARTKVVKKDDRVVFWENFSERLTTTIEKKKMSKTEFANAVGVSYVAVKHWIDDGRIPSAYYLNKICTVLKVSADYLIGRKG